MYKVELREPEQEARDAVNQLNGQAEELRAKVDAIEKMIPELDGA
jgi:prefoldin subunit 5